MERIEYRDDYSYRNNVTNLPAKIFTLTHYQNTLYSLFTIFLVKKGLRYIADKSQNSRNFYNLRQKWFPSVDIIILVANFWILVIPEVVVSIYTNIVHIMYSPQRHSAISLLTSSQFFFLLFSLFSSYFIKYIKLL